MTSDGTSELLGGRYSIGRELGRGGAAIVYAAEDTRLGGLVAVKALHGELSGSRIADRFLREVRLLADFEHDNILPILDSGEWNERLYYVMPYVQGSESLRDRLRRQPAGLPIGDALTIARDICKALTYAHARGVLHRDVKPENILLAESRTYLTDFGIAKALTPLAGDENTSSGYILGTQRYMSPEQEVADPTLDGRTDVWSLSCVLYEMLTGLHPFHSPDAARMRVMKSAAAPESPRRHRPSIPDWLERVIIRGLQSNPGDRWQSAEAFAAALRHEATSDQQQSVATRDSRRSTWLAFAIVALAAGGIALVRGRSGDASASPPIDPTVVAIDVSAGSGAPGLADVAARLAASIELELARVRPFRVVPAAQMRACRESTATKCEQLLHELGVGTHLEARLLLQGDSIVALVQVADERTRTITLNLSLAAQVDEPSLSARLASRIATRVRQRLGAYGSVRTDYGTRLDTASLRLLSAVLRERADAESLATMVGTESRLAGTASLRRADSLMALVVARNPGVARLWIERGWIGWAISRRDGANAQAILGQVTTWAESAFVRTPTSPLAHELRGHARLALSESMAAGLAPHDSLRCAAEEDLRQAVAGDPTLHRAWGALSRLLWLEGRTREARIAVSHSMDNDAYVEGARDGYVNLFFANLLLESFDDARRICLSGREQWPGDFKFLECQLTLMLYDTREAQDAARARKLVQEMDVLDSREQARRTGNEYRAIYRDVVAGIVATRSGDRDAGRRALAAARAKVADRGEAGLRFDFSPQEATLLWELGDRAAARRILVDWLKHRPDEIPNFRQDPTWRNMQLTEEVLRAADIPLAGRPACAGAREGSGP